MTDSHLVTVFVDDSIAGPHYFTVAEPSNNVVATFFFPSLNVPRRDIGNHVHATTRAASPAGPFSALLHASPHFAEEDTIR
jgi:hypothetical protein